MNGSRLRCGGAILVSVAISLMLLLGCAALALDVGRLYVNKTELQNAADACALGAAQSLRCSVSAAGCSTDDLDRAKAVGQALVRRHRFDFQRDTVLAADIRFSQGYAPESASESATFSSATLAAEVNDPPVPLFAACITRNPHVDRWFSALFASGDATVSATAVASLMPPGHIGQTAGVPAGSVQYLPVLVQ